jgi:hypothetical protein
MRRALPCAPREIAAVVTLTNTSNDALDMPLYGIGALEPGTSVDVPDDIAAELAGHPHLAVKTTTKSAAKAVTTEGTASDGD